MAAEHKFFHLSTAAQAGHGLLLLSGGIGVLIAPYFFLGWMMRLLPLIMVILAVVWTLKLPGHRHRTKSGSYWWRVLADFGWIRLAGGCGLLLTGGYLWLHPRAHDGALWYLVAAEFLYVSVSIFLSTSRSWRAHIKLNLCAVIMLLMALIMLWQPSSGLSAALAIVGAFAAFAGVVLLLQLRRD